MNIYAECVRKTFTKVNILFSDCARIFSCTQIHNLCAKRFFFRRCAAVKYHYTIIRLCLLFIQIIFFSCETGLSVPLLYIEIFNATFLTYCYQEEKCTLRKFDKDISTICARVDYSKHTNCCSMSTTQFPRMTRL